MEHKTITSPRRSKRRPDSVVALIAHDAKKVDIVMFASQHIETLSQCVLVATGATGSMIADNTGMQVKLMLAGPDGGDLQIGGLIASGEIDMVIFFRAHAAAVSRAPAREPQARRLRQTTSRVSSPPGGLSLCCSAGVPPASIRQDAPSVPGTGWCVSNRG
jgi:methylglyoxal synthase